MRWLIQILVMIGDLLLILACAAVLCYIIFPVNVLLVFATYRTWKGQGGFIAWTHSKQFLINAEKYGL
jgi:hypothetical protein